MPSSLRFSPCGDETCCVGCVYVYNSTAADTGGPPDPDTPPAGPTEDPDHAGEFSEFWTLAVGSAYPDSTQYIFVDGESFTVVVNSETVSLTQARWTATIDQLHNGDVPALIIDRQDADNYVKLEFSNITGLPRLALWRITAGEPELLKCKENDDPDFDGDSGDALTLKASLCLGVLLCQILNVDPYDHSGTHSDHDLLSNTYRPLRFSYPPNLDGFWGPDFTMTSGSWGVGGTAADSASPFRFSDIEAWDTVIGQTQTFYGDHPGCKPDTLCCGMIFETPISILISTQNVTHSAASDAGDCVCTDINTSFENFWAPFAVPPTFAVNECHFHHEGPEQYSCTNADDTDASQDVISSADVQEASVSTDGNPRCAIVHSYTQYPDLGGAGSPALLERTLPQFWRIEDAIGEFDNELIAAVAGICDYSQEQRSIAGFTFEAGDCRGRIIHPNPATITWTANAAAFRATRQLSAQKRTFTLTANSAVLRLGKKLTAAVSTFTLTANTARLAKGFRLRASAAAFTLTGRSAGLHAGHTITATLATFTLSGRSATLRMAHRLSAARATFTLTGIAAALQTRNNRILTASVATFTLSANAAGLRTGHRFAAARAIFTLTGRSASLRTTRKLTAARATFTYTANAAALRRSRKLIADPYHAFCQSLTPTGFRAGRRLTASRATFTQSGISATLRAPRKLSASKATFTCTAIAAGLRRDRRLTAARSIYLCQTLADTGLRFKHRLTATKATFTLTGMATVLRPGHRLTAEPYHAFCQSLTPTGFRVGRRLAAAKSTFTLSAKAASLRATRRLSAAKATFTLTANAATLSRTISHDTTDCTTCSYDTGFQVSGISEEGNSDLNGVSDYHTVDAHITYNSGTANGTSSSAVSDLVGRTACRLIAQITDGLTYETQGYLYLFEGSTPGAIDYVLDFTAGKPPSNPIYGILFRGTIPAANVCDASSYLSSVGITLDRTHHFVWNYLAGNNTTYPEELVVVIGP